MEKLNDIHFNIFSKWSGLKENRIVKYSTVIEMAEKINEIIDLLNKGELEEEDTTSTNSTVEVENGKEPLQRISLDEDESGGLYVSIDRKKRKNPTQQGDDLIAFIKEISNQGEPEEEKV